MEEYGEIPYGCDLFTNEKDILGDDDTPVLGIEATARFEEGYQDWIVRLVELVKEELKGC